MIQTFEAVVVKTVAFGVGMDKLTNTEEQAWKQTHAELWYKTEVTCLISWVKTDPTVQLRELGKSIWKKIKMDLYFKPFLKSQLWVD